MHGMHAGLGPPLLVTMLFILAAKLPVEDAESETGAVRVLAFARGSCLPTLHTHVGPVSEQAKKIFRYLSH